MGEQSIPDIPQKDSVTHTPFYTPESREYSVPGEFLRDAAEFADHIESHMELAGFPVSREWTEDELGPKHVSRIGESSKYPRAKIIRRYRRTDYGGAQVITYVKFSTARVLRSLPDFRFQISSRKGWTRFQTWRYRGMLQNGDTKYLNAHCRPEFDIAMEKFLRGE